MHLITDNPQGQPVTVLTFDTGVDEAERIARRIREAVEAGQARYRDFAIFLRINALSRGLETAFVQQRVPHQIVRGLAFFERKENRDILAYLRLMVNPRDDLSFLRIVNEPARGIGKVSLDHLRTYAEPREMSLLSAAAEVAKIPAIKGKAASGLRSFHQLITELSNGPGGAARRGDSASTRPKRLSRHAALQRRERGPGSAGQHRGTHHGGEAVRGRGQQPDHRRLSGEHHAGQRPRQLGRTAGLCLDHDPARGQGTGVPRRVHGGGGARIAAARAQHCPSTKSWKRNGDWRSSA